MISSHHSMEAVAVDITSETILIAMEAVIHSQAVAFIVLTMMILVIVEAIVAVIAVDIVQ